MNLAFYLLLTPTIQSEASHRASASPLGTSRRSFAILDPVRPGFANGPALRQASRFLPAPRTRYSLNADKLGFAAGVVFNAMGYLLLTTGLLLLLQIAQASMGPA